LYFGECEGDFGGVGAGVGGVVDGCMIGGRLRIASSSLSGYLTTSYIRPRKKPQRCIFFSSSVFLIH
jgi:hypothetical protein